MAAANTENYIHLRVARSDGRAYDIPHNEIHLKVEDRTQSVDQNSEQPTRWKASIGAHIKYQLQTGSDDRLYLLRDFPTGYELRIQPKKDKVHAYLYGHPKDSKTRYRTPAEFVPHLLWLISESADREDCSCQFCVEFCGKESHADARKSTLASASAVGNVGQRQSGPPGPQGQPQTQSSTSPVGNSTAHLPPQSHLAASQVVTTPVQPTTQSVQPTTQPVQPTAQPVQSSVSNAPPPGMTSPSNVFRVGELVWYKNTAWRLGIVLVIAPKANTLNPALGEENYRFLLAPLGHSLLGQQNILKEATEMRPFLTFSVPDISIAELRDKAFAEVDWHSFVNRYAPDPDPAKRTRKLEVIGLEASKMAARFINASFSTFNLFPGPPIVTGPNAYLTKYGGVYLGAEMIRLGDPVRVNADEQQPASEAISTVMIVQEIQLNTSPTAPPGLKFRGSIYQLRRADPSQMDTAADSPGPELGPACLDEVNFRNDLAAGSTTAPGRWRWVPLEHGASRGEADVQGRFYVTHRLMRIIDPARLQAAVQQRALEDAQGAYLNGRMQGIAPATATTPSGYAGWRPGRAGTLGLAVATRLVLPEGIVEEAFADS